MADPTKNQSENHGERLEQAETARGSGAFRIGSPGVRKKLPKELAVIDAANCTGCAACIEVCPVDCIVAVSQHPDMPGLQGWCEIDWDRCIGCRLCIRLPKKKASSYTMLVCPWEAIEMVPIAELSGRVELAVGPVAKAEADRSRLRDSAQRQIRLSKL